ncbi:diacylglycerol/lipid kinase family protein [Microbacterium sp. P07]|uniref:diacylglycerol/lipid kinase family protein n=1 Tax=Microbacterium sp. P07 TaxID=3366952 RepID=UPI003745D962
MPAAPLDPPADHESAAHGSEGAPGPRGADTDAPDPLEAAAPDDVIRQSDDVAPDSAAAPRGEARRVDADGETTSMAAPERTGKRAALVYNPTKVVPATLRSRVSRLSAEAGWDAPLFFETTVDDLGGDATRGAVVGGVDAILVAGGDGTVRAVAEALTDTGMPLSIVPSGTGNLLARNLNLPLADPDAMIRATFHGDIHSTDAGVARLRRPDGSTEEHGFVVMAGMGLDAAMIANTSAQLKRTVGWVAYVDGAARSLVNAKPFRIMYQLDDHRLHGAKIQSILFANCGTLPAGIELIPGASIGDGLMDVAIIQPTGPFGWLGVWRKVAWDNSVLRRFRAGRRVLERRGRDTSVRYLRGREIETATMPAQPVELDGDEFGEATRIHCRIVAGGLKIVVPKGHDTSKL